MTRPVAGKPNWVTQGGLGQGGLGQGGMMGGYG